MKPKIIFTVLILLLNCTFLYAESLWKEDSASPYGRNRNVKVGDVLTVQIIESTTALQQAQTDLSKKSGVNMDVVSSWERVANLVSNTDSRSQRGKSALEAGGGDDYLGKGQTARKSSVKARMTVMVTSRLDENLYEIEGTHQVKVNEEVEKIFIKGLIRKQDIGSDNVILSSQIANAQISIEGNGSVSSKQSPGVLTRLFGWLF